MSDVSCRMSDVVTLTVGNLVLPESFRSDASYRGWARGGERGERERDRGGEGRERERLDASYRGGGREVRGGRGEGRGGGGGRGEGERRRGERSDGSYS